MPQLPSIGFDIMLKKLVVVILSIILLTIFGLSLIIAYPNVLASTMEQQTTNQILEYEKWNCGMESAPNSNYFVTEFKVPEICSIPIAITFDNVENKVWFISTRNGTLFGFNPSKQIF